MAQDGSLEIYDLENLLSELQCTKCEKLLSVLPIYTSSSIGNVCGRCTQSVEELVSNNSIERNTTYESIAKYLSFPCSNRGVGCKTLLKYDKIENHENCCNYRQVTCPFNVLKCCWNGEVLHLYTHLNVDHKLSEINNPYTFILNMDETEAKLNFVKVESQTFILLTRYKKETNKFSCLVMCCDEEEICESYEYQVGMGKESNVFFMFLKNNTAVLMPISQALNQVDNMITIDVSALKMVYGNVDSNIYCKITISQKSNEIMESTLAVKPTREIAISLLHKVPQLETSADDKLMASNELFLEELECPVCNNHMRPPIFICTQGHSLCSECNRKVLHCPVCRVELTKCRNFTLENLARNVLYPCKYSVDGCKVVSLLCDSVKHQSICRFRSDCPLKMLPSKCSVKVGVVCPIAHINERHSKDLLRTNTFYLTTVKADVSSNFNVVIRDNKLFIICCQHGLNIGSVKFNVFHLVYRMISNDSDEPKYKYRLEFLDRSKLGLKLIAEQVCEEEPLQIDSAFDNCLTIPWSMLQPLASSDVLLYRFDIRRI